MSIVMSADARAIIGEIRTMSWLETPAPSYVGPPSDDAAERSVIEAILCGRRTAAGLPCAAADFFLPGHTAIVATVAVIQEAGVRLNTALIINVLVEQVVDRDRCDAYLAGIMRDEPMRALVDELAERVHELAEQRRAIRLMQRLDSLWRVGEAHPPELISELRERLSRWAP